MAVLPASEGVNVLMRESTCRIVHVEGDAMRRQSEDRDREPEDAEGKEA